MLVPEGEIIGAGAMSAGYGGTGEALTYQASAEFNFVTATSGQLDFALLSNAFSGMGFDSLSMQIEVDGGQATYAFSFSSLSVAEAFFSANVLDLGAIAAGDQTVNVLYALTASEPGAGFGFAYDFGLGVPSALFSAAVPEPSTWAMTLLGFAGLGFAGRAAGQGRAPAGQGPGPHIVRTEKQSHDRERQRAREGGRARGGRSSLAVPYGMFHC